MKGIDQGEQVSKPRSSQLAPKVAIVTDFFVETNNNRARRIRERASYLAANGYSVRVYFPSRGQVDNYQSRVAEGVLGVPVRARPESVYSGRSRISRQVFAPLRGLLRGYTLYAIKVLWNLRCEPVECVYTINNPVSLHLVGLLCSRAKWIAEFRDPVTGYPHSQRGWIGRIADPLLERVVLRYADRICQRQSLERSFDDLVTKYPQRRGKLVLLPEYGVDATYLREQREAAPGVGSRWPIVIGKYAGKLYGKLSFSAIDNALNRVSTRERCDLRIEFIGVSRNSCEGESQRKPAYSRLVLRPAISHEEVIGELVAADFVIGIDYVHDGLQTSYKGYLPSKFAEVFSTGRPVLVLADGESAMADWVESRGCGAATRASSSALALDSALSEIVAYVRCGVTHPAAAEETALTYSIRHSEAVFKAALDDTLRSGNEPMGGD